MPDKYSWKSKVHDISGSDDPMSKELSDRDKNQLISELKKICHSYSTSRKSDMDKKLMFRGLNNKYEVFIKGRDYHIELLDKLFSPDLLEAIKPGTEIPSADKITLNTAIKELSKVGMLEASAIIPTANDLEKKNKP